MSCRSFEIKVVYSDLAAMRAFQVRPSVITQWIFLFSSTDIYFTPFLFKALSQSRDLKCPSVVSAKPRAACGEGWQCAHDDVCSHVTFDACRQEVLTAAWMCWCHNSFLTNHDCENTEEVAAVSAFPSAPAAPGHRLRPRGSWRPNKHDSQFNVLLK